MLTAREVVTPVGVGALQRQHLAPQPAPGAAELADLEHLGAVLGLRVVGAERHRPGHVLGRCQRLPAAGPAGAVGADGDAVAVGAGLAGQQGRELARRGAAGPAGVEVAVLLGDDDVEPVELRQLDGDVVVGDGAHLRAAVVVVEDLLVGPALEGVAERPVLAHAPAVAEAVADEVDGGAGEGGGRLGVGGHHRRDGAERRQGQQRRGQRRRQPATPAPAGRRPVTGRAPGRRRPSAPAATVSAPRNVASPKGAMPPSASAM